MRRWVCCALAVVFAVVAWVGALMPYHPHEEAPLVAAGAMHLFVPPPGESAPVPGAMGASLEEMCGSFEACHSAVAWMPEEIPALGRVLPSKVFSPRRFFAHDSADLRGLLRPPNGPVTSTEPIVTERS